MTQLPMVALVLYGLIATVGLLFGGAWGGLGIGGALLLALLYGVGNKAFPAPDGLAALFVLFMLSAALLSCFQSLMPQGSWQETLKLATILLPLLFLLSPALQTRCRLPERWLFLLVLLLTLGFWAHNGWLFLLFETVGEESRAATKLNRGFSYGVLLVWPVLAALWEKKDQKKEKRGLLALLLLAIGLGLVLTRSRASQAGEVLAVGTFAFAWVIPKVTMGLLGLVGAGSLSWPMVAQYAFTHWHDRVLALPPSWLHRVEIWDYLSYRIMEKPFFGWGIGQTRNLDWHVPHGDRYVHATQSAAHPHNAVVQLWVELGAWGLGLYLFLFFLALYGVVRLRAPLRPFALAAIAFAYALLMSAYNFWTDSLWAALALTVFAFAVLPPRKDGKLRDH
ncbi:MAG: O-antigen ligase family protein [Bdellovibrionales bacterium]